MACYMGQIVLSTLLFENLVDTSEQTVQEEWSGTARRRCVLCAVYCVLCTCSLEDVYQDKDRGNASYYTQKDQYGEPQPKELPCPLLAYRGRCKIVG